MPPPSEAARIVQLEAENARLRSLLDKKGMPGALRHQVRNALGLMRAVLRRSAETKQTVEDLAAHLEGRFDALLRVQTALLSSPDGCIDLATLVSDALMAQAIREGDDATLDGPQVRVGARPAEVLALAFHELATNAVKFGSNSAPDGRLEVTWSVVPSRTITVVWLETGGSAAAHSQALQRGFGLKFIEEALPYQLRAECRVEFPPGGFRCTLAVPTDALQTS